MKISRLRKTINENNDQLDKTFERYRKRSLVDNDRRKKIKRCRCLSSKKDNHSKSSLNGSSSINACPVQRTRKYSTNQYAHSIEHLNKINLPSWDTISPNIEKILSMEHTQTGVFEHEIHLIQQELEALLSLSVLHENLFHSIAENNSNNTKKYIEQYQQAENVYSSKIIQMKSSKLLPYHKKNSSASLSDRKLPIKPMISDYIDTTWSDIYAYYSQISSDDTLFIENANEFNNTLKSRINQYEFDYRNKSLTQTHIIQRLKNENLQYFTNFNPLIGNYFHRTTIERFQTILYEHMKKNSSYNYHSKSRSSLRIDSIQKAKHISSSHLKPKNEISSKTLHEKIEFVHNYLTIQHPVRIEYDKQIDKFKTRKNANKTRIDSFQRKLSTLLYLLEECSILFLSALKHARIRYNGEHNWNRLNTIECNLEQVIEKIHNSNQKSTQEKLLGKLKHLINDWTKHENDFNQQYHSLYSCYESK